MKFILATFDNQRNFRLELFDSKKEVLEFLKREKWTLYDSPKIDEWEDCTDVTLIGYKGILCEAYLRAVKG